MRQRKELLETADLTGMEEKFIVLKIEDINKYLGIKEQMELAAMGSAIITLRAMENKPNNKHLVINTDEPYADEVIAILKKHGH